LGKSLAGRGLVFFARLRLGNRKDTCPTSGQAADGVGS
jgi:hypothetical protein